MVDVASFMADDCDALVQAALACRVCLRGDVTWWLDPDAYDPKVHCACRHCGHRRPVYLSGLQTLRLAIGTAGSR